MTENIGIALTTDPNTKEVTLFVLGKDWGPIVTGKDLDEAKSKMKEAMRMSMIFNSLASHVEGKVLSQIPERTATINFKELDSQIDGVSV